ncbi:hypothetical protein [Aphanothece hegewaldii]|uniref:hypothetical protein n=1 Tax=Aphanothece hegewaldii TaxID=1521625 RepID=UPI0015E6A948|nr:hypothetical protein [Aphanothece hegewaldii]
MIRWGQIWKIVITQVLCAIACVTIYELFFRIDYVEQRPDGTVIMSNSPCPKQ